MPLGGLITGSTAGAIGITAATCINAAACFVLAILFACWLPRLRSEARPVLERAGMLPEAKS
jgi:hypothetical protein